MIPRIVHQTWKDGAVPPKMAGYVQSWKDKHPDWEHRLWTDRDLLEFVAERYPDLLKTFCQYPHGVMRADAGRYVILHAFGGVYADIDAECVAPFDALTGEDRAVIGLEPAERWKANAAPRSHDFILFNGVMASPPGHAFWRHLIDALPTTAGALSALDATGPCFMTGRFLSFEDKPSVLIKHENAFAPLSGVARPDTLCVHHWAGTWWEPDPAKTAPRLTLRKTIRTSLRKAKSRLRAQPAFDDRAFFASFDQSALSAPIPPARQIAVFTPVRDGAQHIEPLFRRLASLDTGGARLRVVFCEGDSVDRSRPILDGLPKGAHGSVHETVVLDKRFGAAAEDRSIRWKPAFQRARRARLAKVRNHMIRFGLEPADDWVLWIDVDVWRFSDDVLPRLLAERARIVSPNCCIEPGGPSFDLNSFIDFRTPPEHVLYRHLIDGLYQPRARNGYRLHLDSLRHSERVSLHGVGGAMLLVDAGLHRAGLTFPEAPYKRLIETEAFGMLAHDLGCPAVGLPNVEVLHVPD